MCLTAAGSVIEIFGAVKSVKELGQQVQMIPDNDQGLSYVFKIIFVTFIVFGQRKVHLFLIPI